MLSPFEVHLQAWWQQGEHTTPGLFRLLVVKGYTGSIHTVRHWVQRRRQEPAPHTKPTYRATYTIDEQHVAALAAAQQKLAGPRELVWLLLKPLSDLPAEDLRLFDVLREKSSIAQAYLFAQRFLLLVRQRDLAALDGWLTDCQKSGIPELANYAAGLLQDEAAVHAALTLEWSTQRRRRMLESLATLHLVLVQRSLP
jgi:transposase